MLENFIPINIYKVLINKLFIPTFYSYLTAVALLRSATLLLVPFLISLLIGNSQNGSLLTFEASKIDLVSSVLFENKPPVCKPYKEIT